MRKGCMRRSASSSALEVGLSEGRVELGEEECMQARLQRVVVHRLVTCATPDAGAGRGSSGKLVVHRLVTYTFGKGSGW